MILDAKFTHGTKCRGSIVLDLSGLFTFKSPSISIGETGISIGVTEVQSRVNSRPKFVCQKCNEEFPMDGALDTVKGKCSVCGEQYLVRTMWTCRELSTVCDSCKEYVGKESLAGAPHKVAEALRYLLLPEADKIKFWRLTEVFKMKISIM